MIDYTGLRKRPTFEGIVDYLANRQETTKYPDRMAKQIRDHPYMTQLDGEGMLEIEEMEQKKLEHEYREKTAKELADQNNVSAQVARAVSKPQTRSFGTQDGARTSTTGTQAGDNVKVRQAEVQVSATTKERHSQTQNQSLTRDFGTDAPPIDMVVDAWIDDDLVALRQSARRTNMQVRNQVAHNLGQPEATLGVIPYIENYIGTPDAMSEDESGTSGRSRTPHKDRKTVKQEDAVLLPIEQRTGASSSSSAPAPKAKAKAKAQPIEVPSASSSSKKPDDDDVVETGVTINTDKRITYWQQQSANEIRAQLNLRFPGQRGDFAFKSKAQLVEIVRQLIKDKKW